MGPNHAFATVYSLPFRAWVARRVELDQCLKLQLFNRDCETAQAWIESREAFIKDDEGVSEGDGIGKVEQFGEHCIHTS